MDKYFYSFREMISLRGLTDHTLKSYCTYIHSYLDYLSNILHKLPEDVTWDELRTYIRWLQKERNLSDRTINHAISQLRFFTMYVLHKPWETPSSLCGNLTLICLMSHLYRKYIPFLTRFYFETESNGYSYVFFRFAGWGSLPTEIF